MNPISFMVIRQNWLTQKIDSFAVTVAALTTLTLLLGGIIYWGNHWGAEQWMAATKAQVLGHHEWWRAWTTLLVHADMRHLASNSLLFFILGIFLYGYFGWTAFPFLAFFAGGLTNIYVLSRMPDDTQLIGASGVVFWMGGFWLILYFLIDRRKSLVKRALRSLGVGLALFMPTEAFDPTISYASHLVGFFSGIFCGGLFYLLQRRKIESAEIKEIIFEESDDEIGNHDQGPI